jgi:perosamine synthetase
MDVGRINEKITRRTKAIIPVHIYGHPVEMDPILDLAEEHDLYVIEDAAEAHGAEYRGRRTGGLGHIGCFSFYANKIITTGEGGMMMTSNEEIYERARLLRDHAFEDEKRFWHRFVGFNFKMTNLQAAVGVAQLERIEEFVQIRRRNAKLFNSLLADVEGMTLPVEEKWAKNVYWMYSILIEDSFGITRDELRRRLEAEGVDTRTFFYPIHTQPVYAKDYIESYPVAEDISRKGMNLPSGNTLTEEEVRFVANSILSNTIER